MDYAWGTISNDIPWYMCFVIDNTPPGGVGFMHWVHSNINAEYQGKLSWMVFAMSYIYG
jgi:phosphatidylethanolamine-binding protein (PEBP) family uncharacterized protein